MKKSRYIFLPLPFIKGNLSRILFALPGEIRRHGSASAGILRAFAGRIQPRPFFAGLLLGAVTMLGLGKWAKRHDTFGDRIRFFQAVSPERGIYPTIDNLAAFVHGMADPVKILILVAGSSIGLGIGQPEEDLWSRKLQEDLGEGFSVVNVSFRSNRFNLIGIPLMEHLRREFPRHILICDLWPLEQEPLPLRSQNPQFPYNYVAWQEVAARLLRGELAAFHKIRAECLAGAPAERSFIQEQVLSGLWETVTGASAFWNWVGYRLIFTANPFLHPLKPVFFEQDDDSRQHYLPSPERFKSNQKREVEIVAGQIVAARNLESSPAGEPEAAATPCDPFPDDTLKRRTIFLMNSCSSYYLAQLPPQDRAYYEDFVRRRAARLGTLGFGTAVLGLDYPHSFYVDGQHFSWEAAPAIAAAVAKEVRRLSREQGF